MARLWIALIWAFLCFIPAYAEEGPVTVGSCSFAKPLADSWQDARKVREREGVTDFSSPIYRQVVATAILAWKEKGMRHDGNPNGLVPAPDNLMLDNAMLCYVQHAICGMPRDYSIVSAFRAMIRTRQWKAGGIPEYAPPDIVAWAEETLQCQSGMTPIDFAKPESARPNPNKPGVSAEVSSLQDRCKAGGRTSCDRLVRHYDKIARAGGRDGLSINQAWSRKIDWAETSCQFGVAYGCDAAGWAYEHGQESRVQDHVKAYKFYKKGCESDAALSCNNLALAYENGRGVAQNLTLATTNFDRACVLGYSDACKKIPWRNRNYPSVPQSLRALFPLETLQDMQSGAHNSAYFDTEDRCEKYGSGAQKDCFAVAWMEEAGYWFDKPNLTRARSFYDRACQQGLAQGCDRFSEMNAKGLGGSIDYYVASPYLSRLCKSGDSAACDNYHLGVLHSLEVASVARVESAAEYYFYHCEKTPPSAAACFNLGLFLQSPLYNRREDALRLFDQACSIKDGLAAACAAKTKLSSSLSAEARARQAEWERQNQSRGLGGFLSDLGRGINQATSTQGALTSSVTVRSEPTPAQQRAARATLSRQDWQNFDNAVRATNNIGTAYNSNCSTSNPYC